MDLSGSTTAARIPRLDALRRLREVATALGPRRVLILLRLVVFDESWCALARTLRCSPATARRHAVTTPAALLAQQSGQTFPRSESRTLGMDAPRS